MMSKHAIANRTVLIVALIFFALPASAQGPRGEEKEPLVFQSEQQEARFKDLTLELRCLVCQNQNLADSDAPLAQQLRGEIFDMLQDGKTDREITGFMVDRYGDFVLYSPPVQGNTLALWTMPIVLLLIGAIGVFFTVRNRSRKLAAVRQKENT
ncbi:MAG: cytochrome c-type biogenesis protein CcmH [Gammaproteobacteria bacterium]|nr:cytochrome c-type biogenesis protein CcmH [Gammaproteobacteria bacterium]NNJ78557.1 cytochrome c-type biogenesis protein CcmH [Xanthomonadales bacterium]